MAKSKYVKDFPARAEAYAKQGLIDKEIARKLGISKQTFYDYQKKHPDFLDSLKRGKAPVDFKVENALLKRAMGYEYEETTVEYDAAVEDQKAKPKKIKTTTKRVIPDVAACIFWLKNRKPKKWRDKQNIELSGEDDEPVKIEFVPVKKKKEK